MAYTPSLADIPQEAAGYAPSLADLPPENSGFMADLTGLLNRGTANLAQGVAPINRGGAAFGGNLLADLGRLTGNNNLVTLGHNAPQAFPDPNASSIGDELLTGAAQYGPYAIAAEEMPASLGMAALPYAGRFLSPAVQRAIVAGGAFGATQTPNPISGGLESAGLNAALGNVGTAFSLIPQGAKTAASNFILNRLKNASSEGSALTPEETAENLSTNYSDQNGKPLPVDIGTLTNSPGLSNIYNSLGYVPFSGVNQKQNILKTAMNNRDISNIQEKLNDVGTQNSAISAQQDALNTHISGAPDFLNQLASGLGNRTNLTGALKDSVQGLYKQRKAISDQNYEPINDNADLPVVSQGDANALPNYSQTAQELLNQRGAFETMFGDDNDLSFKLRGELDKAHNLVNNAGNYNLTLGEATTRVKNLGDLASTAYQRGNRDESRLLSNLGNSLSQDVDTALRNNGNDDIADTLNSANAYYRGNIAPFWRNNEIRKSVMFNDYTPQQAKLAQALHDPNNQSIFNDLPLEAKNAALYQLMTGGKGTSQGLSNLDAQGIANRYQRLPVDTKVSVSQYNPQADQYFENLQNALDKNKDLSDTQNQLSKTQQALADQLDKEKQNKFGLNKHSAIPSALGIAGIGAALLKPSTLGLSPLIPLSRGLGNVLADPELAQAYINGSRIPFTPSSPSIWQQALNRAMPVAGMSAMSPPIMQGGQ